MVLVSKYFSFGTFLVQMYNLAYEKAREMLQKNCEVLKIIVEQLLECENLTGEVSVLLLTHSLEHIFTCISLFLKSHNFTLGPKSDRVNILCFLSYFLFLN